MPPLSPHPQHPSTVSSRLSTHYAKYAIAVKVRKLIQCNANVVRRIRWQLTNQKQRELWSDTHQETAPWIASARSM